MAKNSSRRNTDPLALSLWHVLPYESRDRVAKITDREKILKLIHWRGDEQVLAVGCGRGLMLIGAAQRLTRGKAIGIDLWLERDQSSNSANATLENAKLEGVSEHVSVETADIRKLPFLTNLLMSFSQVGSCIICKTKLTEL